MKMTESKLRALIKECLENTINEGTNFPDLLERWDNVLEILGPEKMLSDIQDYLSSDQIEDLLNQFEKDLDL